MLHSCVASTVLLEHSNPSENSDSISRQMHGDKECPFIGVTNYGSFGRRVLESNTWSVGR